MIPRDHYLNILRSYRDIKLVKILAGVRRSGKSTILEMLRSDLIDSGVKGSHIIYLRFTSSEFEDGLTHKDMVDLILKMMKEEGRYYLLLDEVQEVDQWEKGVNSLFENVDCDIYLSGSNSKLLAGEISTYLSGRYVSIDVFPLSFKEYLSFKKDQPKSIKEKLLDYIKFGGFPLIASNEFEEKTAYQIVEGIYNSVVNRDIGVRHNIVNFNLFNRTVMYIFENVGKTFSANAIVKFLKNEKRSLTVETIYNYIDWLEKAFIIYRCPRFDLQGKEVLKTQEKFYLVDSSFKYALMGYSPKSVAAMLENIVYFELRRRGYKVYVGKYFSKEIDFVGKRNDEMIYIQVCRQLPEDSDREIENLVQIKDHHPKYVVTLDDLAGGNINGIKLMHLSDFLLSENL